VDSRRNGDRSIDRSDRGPFLRATAPGLVPGYARPAASIALNWNARKAGTEIGGEACRGLSLRTRAIDHLLYEINSGFWRWVTGGRGNVLSIGVVVIASTRPPPKWLLGLGQP
jgi:hypothetical protein